MAHRKWLLWSLLLAVLLCGCVRQAATTGNTPSASTCPATQTQPDPTDPTEPPQQAGPILMPSVPQMPTLPDTVPPIVVPTVPVLPHPDPETQ